MMIRPLDDPTNDVLNLWSRVWLQFRRGTFRPPVWRVRGDVEGPDHHCGDDLLFVNVLLAKNTADEMFVIDFGDRVRGSGMDPFDSLPKGSY